MHNKILMSTAVNSENQSENFKGWLFTMGEEYAKIKVLLSKVIAGNEEAEKKLNLHPIKVDIDEAKITRMELQLAHKQHSEIAAATKALYFPNLEAWHGMPRRTWLMQAESTSQLQRAILSQRSWVTRTIARHSWLY